MYPGPTTLTGVPKTSAVPIMTRVPHHGGNSISGNVNALTLIRSEEV
jgi:hypothetical protein